VTHLVRAGGFRPDMGNHGSFVEGYFVDGVTLPRPTSAHPELEAGAKALAVLKS
jgi:hypothetical protein